MAAFVCAGLWYISYWRPHLALAIGESRSRLHFGRGLAGFNILNFISRNADNVLIGRFTSATQLGYYDRAYKLLLFPLSQINNPVGRVLIPILSRLVDQPERYRQAYLRAVGQLLLFTIPGVGFLITNAEQLVPAVLGPQWRSEEHTSELQSLMRISYAVFCLKKKKDRNIQILKSSQ